MADPFIFISSYTIKPGRKDEYLERFRAVKDIVESEEPRMLYFGEHVSEDGSETTTVQVHADADNMAHHMQLVGDHIQESGQYLDFESMSIRIFGSPSEEVLEQMRQLAGSGVSVTVSRAEVSFNRLPAVTG